MSEVIVFDDEKFEYFIRNKLNIFDRPITNEDAKKVKDLTIGGQRYGIENIKGIEYFTGLESLYISGITLEKGILALKNASKLRNLTLEDCGLKDVYGIKNFDKLETVNLSNNYIECAQELENITTLEEIYINTNKIKNIEFCKKLRNLKRIEFDYNDVSSLEGLEDNKQITCLSARRNKIINIDIIEKLETLESLDLCYNKNIENFSPLGTLTNIEKLYLSGCNLLNLEFLQPIKTLHELWIDKNNLNNELELDYIVQNNPIEYLKYNYNPLAERLKSQVVSIPNKQTEEILQKKLCLWSRPITQLDIQYITNLAIKEENELDVIKYYKNLKKLTINRTQNFKSSVSSNFEKFNNIKEVTIHDSGWNYKVDEYMQVEQAIDKICNEINKDWTELEKARYIYEILGQTITYDYSGVKEYYSKEELSSNKAQERIKKTRNLYGPLVEGKAVCVGYANAYSEICNRVGIRCEYIGGDVTGIENSQHAWNTINISNKWYYCDLTWDARNIKQGTNLKYFCKSEKTMEENHRVDWKWDKYSASEDIDNELIKAAEMKLGIRSCNDKINQFERERFNNGFDMPASMNKDIFTHNKVSQRTDEIRTAI